MAYYLIKGETNEKKIRKGSQNPSAGPKRDLGTDKPFFPGESPDYAEVNHKSNDYVAI